MSPNTPPRILLPTVLVARFRKKDDMPGDGYAIDTDANPKLADAHEGARPPGLKNTDADASQNCVDADVGFGSRPLPAAYLSPYAKSLVVSSVDRSLLLAPAVRGLITPENCLA